jgi:hypothetical protein
MLYREITTVYSQIHTKDINTLCGQNVEFLGAFAKLWKATACFVMSVSPSVRPSFCPHYSTRLPLEGF